MDSVVVRGSMENLSSRHHVPGRKQGHASISQIQVEIFQNWWSLLINENDTSCWETVYQDYQPRIFPGVTNRFFNLVGRGHEVIVVPNVYHENHAEPIITTGLDFTIYPKNDYDLLRISTNFGTELEYGVFSDVFEEHPLHWRYTREFYLDGASAGTEIKLHASTRIATVGGVPQPLGVRHIDVGKVNGESRILTTPRQAFMVAPVGSYRIRVEFYKRVTETIEDDGWNLS